MNKLDYEGIKFGFTFVIIWLLLLTGYTMYDKMSVGNTGFSQTILLPPPSLPELEVINNE